MYALNSEFSKLFKHNVFGYRKENNDKNGISQIQLIEDKSFVEVTKNKCVNSWQDLTREDKNCTKL